jgi:DNA-binding transcriptional LysR family regulator
MQDLNDLFAFAKVVQHVGFSAAARALHVTKSSLSKRVARLEESYGARLIERSTRGIRVTPVGRAVYAQCEALIAAAEGAAAVAAKAIALPKGAVRVACPPGLLPNILTPILPSFLAAYPEVRLALAISNRRVDMVEEGFDVAIRVRERLETDQDAVVRQLGVNRRILVADPTHLSRRAPVCGLTDLPKGPLLTLRDEAITERWTLWNEEGAEAFLDFAPTLACSDLHMLLEATMDGLGIALLPETLARLGLSTGRLLHVLPAWRAPDSIVHMVFPSRRGMAPATRAFVEHVGKQLPQRFAAALRNPVSDS